MVAELEAVDGDRLGAEHRQPWDDLVIRAKSSGPNNAAAENIWREANILASEAGIKTIVFQRFIKGCASSPFPCDGDALLPPRRPVAPRAD